MDELARLLGMLNSVTPLGLAVLLGVVLFYQNKNNKTAVKTGETLSTIKGNDLHELPEMAENIRQMAATLQRMETASASNFATIIAVLNGRRS